VEGGFEPIPEPSRIHFIQHLKRNRCRGVRGVLRFGTDRPSSPCDCCFGPDPLRIGYDDGTALLGRAVFLADLRDGACALRLVPLLARLHLLLDVLARNRDLVRRFVDVANPSIQHEMTAIGGFKHP